MVVWFVRMYNILSLLTFVLALVLMKLVGENIVILVSSVVSFVAINSLIRYFGIPRIPLSRLKKLDAFCLLVSIPLPSLMLLSYILKNCYDSYLCWVGVGIAFILLSSNLLIFSMANFKVFRLKKQLIYFSILSTVVSLVLCYILKDNIVLFLQFAIMIFFALFSYRIVKNVGILKIGYIVLSYLVILMSIFVSLIIFLNDLTFLYVILILLSNLGILLLFVLNIQGFKLFLVFNGLWITIIAFLVGVALIGDKLGLYWDVNFPIWLIQAGIISIFEIILFLIVFWYVRNISVTPDMLMEDIDLFLKYFNNFLPREFEDYREFVPNVFNRFSKYIKISILPQNSIPNFILSKLLDRRSLFIKEVFDMDRETVNFFISNGVACIFRFSNFVSETDYLLVKVPRVVKFISPSVPSVELIEEFKPVFVELERTISNFIVAPLRADLDAKRELQVKEIESFDRVKYFLVKNNDVFLYNDKVIAYNYVEDFEKNRGYYFDVVIDINRFIGFLFFIPDRLFLSNFVLLALKGIVKSYPVEEITHDKLEAISNEFLKDRDLPLQISVTSFEIYKDKVLIYPSDNTYSYVLERDNTKMVKDYGEFSRDSVIVVSNKEIQNLTNKIDKKEDKFKSVNKFFSSIVEPDSFVIVCI